MAMRLGSRTAAGISAPGGTFISERKARISRDQLDHPIEIGRGDGVHHGRGVAGPGGDDQRILAAEDLLPQLLGDEGHEGMQQMQQLAQRPGDGGAGLRLPSSAAAVPSPADDRLGELQIPVAELAPDAVIERMGRLVEFEFGERRLDPARQARRSGPRPSG